MAMNGNPVMATTAGTMTATGVATVIDWVLNGCPRPVPHDVSLVLAAVVVILAHLAYARLAARVGVPSDKSAIPANPAAPAA